MERKKTTKGEHVTEYLDTRGAAAFTDYGYQTMCNWRGEGTGPPYIKIGKSVRYSTAALREWMDSHTVRPGGDQR